MAVSNNSFKSRRSGVAIASTIALALGGAAIVAPSSAAAENVRYTDTQEPVEPKQSELNSTALTCGVQLTDTVSSNSGLSYERRVPSGAAGKDRNFGLQVTADTSGERTFNFLNVVDGPTNPPISSRTVTLPPLQPGQTIGPPATGTVNYVEDVPDMVIDPPARGETARKFRTDMDLTDGQVKQIANGGMTIGWKGQYNNDWKADYGYFFSDSGEFLVNGVVNPWPSENADCSPITIDWANQLDTKDYEAKVIQPGTEVKVGTVSADEDSLERLRFIAKDPKGNEVPGEITREGNDIYWTMADYIEGQPAYTQTDAIKFEMIAMPRDLAGLQKAAGENGSLPETVYDSSLAPERYTSSEIVATNTFDIDDAKNHDPNYDSRQENIISGVANNAPTGGRQTRTFTNVADSNGDTLADLVEKYNAEIELDDSNVYEGWDAYFTDPKNGDYTVVVESPEGVEARPGSFGQPVVKVTYSNGTQDIIPLLVIVDPNNTQTTDVVYPPETIRGLIGEEMTSAAPTLKRVIGKNQKPVGPASYTVDQGTVPDGWTINVAPDGTVTATSPANAKAGDMARPKITATYPDGTTDVRELTFLVGDDASLNSPSYPVEVTKPGAPVTHQIQNAPEGVTFTLNNNEVDGWTYSIDPKTGAVTVTPPAGAQGGDRKANTVTVTYPDGTTDVVPVDTVVAHSFNYEAEPHYPEETAYPGEQITSPLSVDKPDDVDFAAENPFVIVPGANFTATGENNEFGNPTYKVATANGEWTVSLDDKGNVISQIPETAKKGDTVSVPVTVTYEDNSTDKVTAVIKVQENPTRQVPFDVEYVYDDTIPAGQYKVVTEGVAGEEKQQRDGTWKRTKEPTNEVVHVGTKSTEAKLKVSWKAPIPYSTITRSNPELAPGETKVVQQGIDGERTYTADLTANGAQATAVSSEDVKQPTPEIIEYGPRLDDQELVTETTRKIPFDTQIIPDDTLAAGTQVVDKQGVVGEETVTSTQKLVDGKPAGDPKVTTERTKEPVDAVIRVGTKVSGDVVAKYDAPVPFPTQIEYDPDLPAGETEVTQEGKNGEKTVTVTQNVVNGQPQGDPTVTENVTTEPTPQIVKVGTKPTEASEQVEWTVPIPYSTVTRPNRELAPGEQKVVQQGVNGERKFTANFTATGDQAEVASSEDIKQPTDEIIEYGPRLADQELVTVTKRKVPFHTTIVADPNLPAGSQQVEKQGVVGEETVTTTQRLVDGKPAGAPSVNTTVDVEKQDAVIRVGTKTKGETVAKYEAEVPFAVEVVYDDTKPAGETEIIQAGVPGKKTVTITQPVVNSQPTGNPTVAEQITVEPTPQKIKVGTKASTASDTVSWTVQTPFETELRPNSALKPGEVNVVRKGVPGEKTYTANFTATGSTATATPTEKTTREPLSEIIEYGPRLADQELVTVTKKPVPFDTEIVFDDKLPAGQKSVDTAGQYGEDTVTSTQKLVDGKPSGDPAVQTERTKEPVKQVIRVGTMTNGTDVSTHKEPVPFTTKIEYDPTLAAGEYKVETAGKPGEKTVTITRTIVNSEVTNVARDMEVTTDPVTEVIKVGTKQATATDTVTWTEPIPFSTVVRPNPNLKPGEVVTVQEGVNGEATYTATFTGTNGEATVKETKNRIEPTEQIIEFGPRLADQQLVTTTERQIPFETTVVTDDTLAAGTQFVEKQGVVGKETVTSTQKLVDGKPAGEPVVTTSTLVEKQDAVIRVGTKTEGSVVKSTEVEIPFTVKVVYDPQLPPGESKVTQQGEPGTKKITITQPVVNSASNGDATVVEEITKKPVEQIVTVGTKPDKASNTATWTAQIPYNTVIRPNPELKPGEVKVVQTGEYGEKKVTADFRSIGDDSVVGTKDEVTRQSKDHIIEYGPTIADQQLTSTTTRPIEFETEFILDETLPAGEQKVDQQGENGEEKITSTQEIKDGKPVGKPTITTEQTKAPKKAIIRVGTTTETTTAMTTTTSSVPTTITTTVPTTVTSEVQTAVTTTLTSTKEVPTTITTTVPTTVTSQVPTTITTVIPTTVTSNVPTTIPTTVTLPPAPTTPTDTTPTVVKPGASSDGSSAKAKSAVERCFGNAVRSPILWLLPIGILGAVGGKVLEPYMAAINQEFGALNAEINRRVQEALPDFGFGGHGGNEQINQLMAQVDAANRQLQAFAGQPGVQQIGQAIGAVAALAALSGVLYDWCSADVGQAKTAIDFGEGSSSRR